MKLPDPLPTDAEELEHLYQAYRDDIDDFDEAEFKRLMDARLRANGIDPEHMTPEQIFGAMSESMNSMLINLYAAADEAPDDEASDQMQEIIRLAEQLRAQVSEAMQEALTHGQPPAD